MVVFYFVGLEYYFCVFGYKILYAHCFKHFEDAELEGMMLTQEGTEFDSENGVLTLKSKDGTNDIQVQFNFNFGTF